MARSISEQLRAYMKTQEFQGRAKQMLSDDKKHKTDIAFYVKRFKTILREEVLKIRSKTTGEAYLDHIVTNSNITTEERKGRLYSVIKVGFDDKEVHRDSLYPAKYPNGVYLPRIVNNGINASNYVYGYDRRGNFIRPNKVRLPVNFARDAIRRFEREVALVSKDRVVVVQYGGYKF